MSSGVCALGVGVQGGGAVYYVLLVSVQGVFVIHVFLVHVF